MSDQDYPKEDINLSLYSIFICIQQNYTEKQLIQKILLIK